MAADIGNPIVNIITTIYQTDDKVENTKHDVTIWYYTGDQTKVTKEKSFTNDVEGMLTFISTNREVS